MRCFTNGNHCNNASQARFKILVEDSWIPLKINTFKILCKLCRNVNGNNGKSDHLKNSKANVEKALFSLCS